MIRTLCENLTGMLRQPPKTVIPEAAKQIFNFDYEFWNEDEKEKFQIDFLRHFYFREIGQETYGVWKVYLEDIFVTVLPYYNKLWAALAKEYDYLLTYDYTEERGYERGNERNRTDNGNSTLESTSDGTANAKTESTGTSTTDNDSEAITAHTSTPQGSLNNMLDGKYLDWAQRDTNNTNGTQNDTSSTETDTTNTVTTNGNTTSKNQTDEQETEKYNEKIHRKGRQGESPSALLREYLNAQRNIEMEFFAECETLFMEVY